MAYMGGVTAASAAAAARRQQMLQAEEENMAQYTEQDLKDDWEFKIVRSDTAAFRKPEVLSRLIEEEALAGWVMLEKFDNTRIRFKRPRSARTQDYLLPETVDPYRTQYGGAMNRSAVLIIIGLILAMLFGVGVLGLFTGGGVAIGESAIIAPAIIGVFVFVILLVVILKQRLR
ncbi:MAG: DUF456 domain-containing protein [Anaerolineae bacterium]|nr:DUF456 domain-containing protein [Anaerolineae bacterium]